MGSQEPQGWSSTLALACLHCVSLRITRNFFCPSFLGFFLLSPSYLPFPPFFLFPSLIVTPSFNDSFPSFRCPGPVYPL